MIPKSKKTQINYNNKLVNKPWGKEYVIFCHKKELAITKIEIMPGKKTSLHCHPKKKTGFIILSGTAEVQIGIHKKNTWSAKPLSILVIRPGLFHSLKCPLNKKSPLVALEFECPYDKNDLVRFKDTYGRSGKEYENKNMSILNNSYDRFINSKKDSIYNIEEKKIKILNIKNYNQIKKMSSHSVSAILSGGLFDNLNQKVLVQGEIIKTLSLKILAKHFKISKDLKIINIANE